jgi:hypothetical protein
MFGLGTLLAKAWFKPLLIVVVIGSVLGISLWKFNSWQDQLKQEGYNRARAEIILDQQSKIQELTDAVEKLSKESGQRAEAMVAQQKTFVAKTTSILIELKNRPLTTADTNGVCKLTPDASRSWNELQKTLAQ